LRDEQLEVAHQQGADAGRTPNLWALSAIMSAGGKGSFPADWAQSTKRKLPAASTASTICSIGWAIPVSELTC
jgi:hypothetical protein